MGDLIGYARAPTIEQNADLQRDAAGRSASTGGPTAGTSGAIPASSPTLRSRARPPWSRPRPRPRIAAEIGLPPDICVPGYEDPVGWFWTEARLPDGEPLPALATHAPAAALASAAARAIIVADLDASGPQGFATPLHRSPGDPAWSTGRWRIRRGELFLIADSCMADAPPAPLDRQAPLVPTRKPGRFVAGVRYRAWKLHAALHPTIGVHAPLRFDLVDRWTRRSLGGCAYHVVHPGGRAYKRIPANASEAEARRASHFVPAGHTAGSFDLADLRRDGEYPRTLDLRRAGRL